MKNSKIKKLPSLKKLLLGKGRPKERKLRRWFFNEYVDGNSVSFPINSKGNDLLEKYISDTQDSSMDYKYIYTKVMHNIKAELLGSGHLTKDQLEKATLGRAASSMGVKSSSIEVDALKSIKEMGKIKFPSFRLHKTEKAFDLICSDFEEKGGIYGGTVNITVGESGVGKTTVLLDTIKSIKKVNRRAKILYITSEMTKNDLKFALKKQPAIGKVPTLLLMEYFRNGGVDKALEQTYNGKFDVIVHDSYEDTIVKLVEMVGWKRRAAETFLLNLMIGAAENDGVSVFPIQHMTKADEYAGTTFLKHATTGMLEFRFASNGRRYCQWIKNRRGGTMVHKKMYYDLEKETGDILWDLKTFERSEKLQEIVNGEEHNLEVLEKNFDESFENQNDLQDKGELVTPIKKKKKR